LNLLLFFFLVAPYTIFTVFQIGFVRLKPVNSRTFLHHELNLVAEHHQREDSEHATHEAHGDREQVAEWV